MEKLMKIIDKIGKKHGKQMSDVFTDMIEDLIIEFYQNDIPVRKTTCDKGIGFQDTPEFMLAIDRLRARHLGLNFEMVLLLNNFEDLIHKLECIKAKKTIPTITGQPAKRLLDKLKNPFDNTTVLEKCKEMKKNFEEK